jgi:hypothetical protein
MSPLEGKHGIFGFFFQINVEERNFEKLLFKLFKLIFVRDTTALLLG